MGTRPPERSVERERKIACALEFGLRVSRCTSYMYSTVAHESFEFLRICKTPVILGRFAVSYRAE